MRTLAIVAVFSLSWLGRAAEAPRPPSVRVDDLYAVARSLEIQPLPARPDWATGPEPPWLVFAWMSDFHLDGGERTPMIRAACHTVRDTIKPHFALFTGDNCAWDPPVSGARAKLPQSERRHLAFRDFLDAELGIPAAVLPGDNWPWDSEKVFGATRFSFDAAGLHLVFLSPDRRAAGAEGCAVFEPATWQWLAQDLQANRERPTLIAMHENLVPPAFLEAPRLAEFLRTQPQVLATLTGHLHLDLEFRRNGLTHVLCPALAAGARPGFKVVSLYPDRLVLNTWEYDTGGRRFTSTLKWQRIEIPEGPLRRALGPVDCRRLLRENRNEMPAVPLVRDQALLQRQGELVLPMLQFVMQMGMQTMAP